MTGSSESWGEYGKHILLELGRLNAAIDKMDESTDIDIKELREKIELTKIELLEKLNEVSKDVLTLKVKAATWGAVAGLVPVIVAMILQYLSTQ